MWYVYVLQSKQNQRIYVGSTNDINRRFREHNCGWSISTKSGCPWNILSVIVLSTEEKARCLEKYFKTGSGRVILLKRILQL